MEQMQLQALIKALEAGSYNAAPGTLNQGSSLQEEDLSPVMHNVTWGDEHIKLQKALKVTDCKSQLVQFNRQLDYGIFGGSAQYEGGIGEEDTSSFVRAVVPMCYYSTTRRVTVAATKIGAFDGVAAEDRSSDDAAKKIAGDVEIDLFKGMADFSNGGLFDGNPGAIADLPNIHGLDLQIRQSDAQQSTQDLMFAEFGSDQTVVLSADGALTQSILEDASVRSAMNMGHAEKFMCDPISLSAYNKIAHLKERIVLAGSAQENSGANLRQQWTSSGAVQLEASRFLSGKTRPARARAGSPAAPGVLTVTDAGAASSLLSAGTYFFYVTACNERGESYPSAPVSQSLAADGNKFTVSWSPVSLAKYYNVYRSEAGGTAAEAKFIGRIKQGVGSPTFTDLGNHSPGSVTGYLVQTDTMGIHQLSAYTKLKLAVSELSLPEASYRFLTLAAYQPRKNVCVDNVDGQLQ